MASQANLQIGKRALLLLLAVAVALLAASGAALAVSKVCPSGTTKAKPCSGTPAADQLTGTKKTDYINGLAGNDVQIGLLGDDFLRGEAGSDVLVGGTEQFKTPNFDTMFGGAGADTNVWAPGDGDDGFRGGGARCPGLRRDRHRPAQRADLERAGWRLPERGAYGGCQDIARVLHRVAGRPTGEL